MGQTGSRQILNATVTATTEEIFKVPFDAIGARFAMVLANTGGTSPTLDVKLQRFDYITNSYIDLPDAAFAQKTADGADDLVIYPDIAETAGRSVSDILTSDMKIVLTVGGSSPTFDVIISMQALT